MADPLTDDDYFFWAEKNEWSLVEAAYLVLGFVPDSSHIKPFKLAELLPDSKRLVLGYLEDRESYPGMHTLSLPQEWLSEAWNSRGVPPLKSWVAIFPHAKHESLNSVLDAEPDYRDFIHYFFMGQRLTLEELVRFALRASPSRIERKNLQKDFNAIIRHFENHLPESAIGRSSGNDSLSWRITPRTFLDFFPKTALMDEECLDWERWDKEHPCFSRWLSSKKGRALSIRGQSPTANRSDKRRSELTQVVWDAVESIHVRGDDYTWHDVVSRLDDRPEVDEVDHEEKKIFSRSGDEISFSRVRGILTEFRRKQKKT